MATPSQPHAEEEEEEEEAAAFNEAAQSCLLDVLQCASSLLARHKRVVAGLLLRHGPTLRLVADVTDVLETPMATTTTTTTTTGEKQQQQQRGEEEREEEGTAGPTSPSPRDSRVKRVKGQQQLQQQPGSAAPGSVVGNAPLGVAKVVKHVMSFAEGRELLGRLNRVCRLWRSVCEREGLYRRLRPSEPITDEELDLARFRADGPDYPLGMAITGATGEGTIMSIQPSVYRRGRGRLHLPTHCDRPAVSSLRVAYSFMLLHQNALQAFFGLRVLLDLTTRERDVRMDQPSMPTGMYGSSCGGVAALALLQAVTGCAFHRDVAMTGELSLTGELWASEDLEDKVKGAWRAGLKKAVLPPLHHTQEALGDPPAGMEVVHVASVFEAMNHMVLGCRRRVVDGSYARPRDLVVVNTVLQSVEDDHWVRKVEIAAVPGHGQLHITGELGEAPCNAVAAALQAVLGNWDNIMACLTKDVARVIDLELMCREGDEGEHDTLDLHVNFTAYCQLVTDCNSTLAVALGLIALSLGLPYPSDVSVCGHVSAGGVVRRVLMTTEVLPVAARRLGVRKIVMCSEEARDVTQGGQAGAAADEGQEERSEVCVADTLFQALDHVFPHHTRRWP